MYESVKVNAKVQMLYCLEFGSENLFGYFAIFK